jgi:hypothetical protein
LPAGFSPLDEVVMSSFLSVRGIVEPHLTTVIRFLFFPSLISPAETSGMPTVAF